jgi:hypothetical protein
MSSALRVLVTGCVLLCLVAPVRPAAGQDQLATEIVMLAGELSATQQAEVRSYVTHWAQPLLQAPSVTAVTDARNRLLEPVRRPRAGDGFKQAYSTAAAAVLSQAPNASTDAARLNAFIVIGQLRGSAAMELAAKGVDDANAGVRYWAAKAIAQQTGASTSVGAGTATTLVEALVPAVRKETEPYVREQLYLALGGMRAPKAREAVVKVLNERLTTHVQKGLDEGLRGEVSAMQRAQLGLVLDFNQGRATAVEIREFAIVVAKYLQVVALAAQDGRPMGATVRPVVEQLAQLGENLLTWAVKTTEPQARIGPKIYAPLKSGNVPAFVLAVFDWVGTATSPGVLQKTKINISLDELKLPQAPAPKASATE